MFCPTKNFSAVLVVLAGAAAVVAVVVFDLWPRSPARRLDVCVVDRGAQARARGTRQRSPAPGEYVSEVSGIYPGGGGPFVTAITTTSLTFVPSN
jgi:hypothetical protein